MGNLFSLRITLRIPSGMVSNALLIGSDPGTRAVLAQVLAELQISSDDCGDLASAEHRIASRSYEVIVIDHPDQQAGARLIQQARHSRSNHAALVVCVVDAQTSVRTVFAVGANLALYRPVRMERVRASLHAASHMIRREKRRYRRAPVHAPTTISLPEVENAPATLVDLSEEGLSIQCERQLPPRSKIYFRFMLPGQMKWIQLSGDTMWQDSTGRAGIRFVDVPQTARRLLRDWLNSRSPLHDSNVTVQLPLSRPGRLPNSPPDRRVQSRHACQLGAEVYRSGVNVPHWCSLTDISAGGCYVEIPLPFPVGTEVEMVVRTHNFKFRSRGTVQTVNPGFGMGVAFAPHTPEQRNQVRELIKLVFRDREAASDPILHF
jgi:DNA-binding response OmpR family regulator